ncbi:hypothetical protein AVEN_25013-1 [Araneus ventricosus]|uniref:Uncharacterized protein n=1 Tax=Araneus ventricosus TaxID=182803 RepID=A0A4Y2FFS7_ARAVE|nr:hypothetical protein AVEN_25013-1 [Araneus ventricosus]
MYIRYETDRHESACVQGTHRLQKTDHFQNRSTRIGVCARNASSAKVDYFETGLQKSVCVQVALGTSNEWTYLIFRLEWVGKKPSLGPNGRNGIQMNCRLKGFPISSLILIN